MYTECLKKIYDLKISAELYYKTVLWNSLRRSWGFHINTLRTGDADLRFYITTVQDG